MRAPAQRPGGPLPLDRRTGVQEGPALQPQRLAGRPHVDEVGARGGHPLRRRAALAVLATWVGRHPGEVRGGAVERRLPVGLGHLDGLVAQRVGEHRGPGRGDHRVGLQESVQVASVIGCLSRSVGPLARSPRRASAVPRGGGVGQVHRRAGRGQLGGTGVEALWVAAGAGQGDDDGQLAARCGRHGPSRPDRVGQLGRGVGVGAVAEHQVEQQHPAARVGRLGGDPLQPQGRVDHRVRPAAGQLVVTEVDDQVGVGAQVGAERQLGRQRDVGPDAAEGTARDQHRLVRQGAAAEQTPQVRRLRPRLTDSAGRGRLGRSGRQDGHSGTLASERAQERLDRAR